MNGSGVSEFFLRDALFERPAEMLRMARVHFCLPATAEVSRWREYVTSVGRIDLLFAWQGIALVVECKKGRASEAAVAQVCRYVGDLNRTAMEGYAHGIVAAEDFDPLAISAAFGANVMLVRLSPAVSCCEVAMPDATRRDHRELFEAMLPAPPTRLGKRRTLRAIAAGNWAYKFQHAGRPGAIKAIVRAGVA